MWIFLFTVFTQETTETTSVFDLTVLHAAVSLWKQRFLLLQVSVYFVRKLVKVPESFGLLAARSAISPGVFLNLTSQRSQQCRLCDDGQFVRCFWSFIVCSCRSFICLFTHSNRPLAAPAETGGVFEKYSTFSSCQSAVGMFSYSLHCRSSRAPGGEDLAEKEEKP